MIGKAITMRITPSGEISDFEVPEDMLAAIKKTPGIERMGGMFSEEGLKQMMAQGMMKFPLGEVAKGDSWNASMEMPNPAFGKQTVESTYTYDGTHEVGEKKLETIGLKLDMKFETAKDSPTQVDLKDQKSNGTIHFDNAQGRMIDTEITMTMKMEITTGGMKIDADMRVRTTVKLNQGKKAA
jgi:hypothetical protein